MSGVLYEVNVDVDAELRDDYLDWLRLHVDEIVALPGFVDAEIAEVDEPREDARAAFSVRYRLVDADALDAYLRDHAPRLRADGLARFGERMRARRRVMRVLAR